MYFVDLTNIFSVCVSLVWLYHQATYILVDMENIFMNKSDLKQLTELSAQNATPAWLATAVLPNIVTWKQTQPLHKRAPRVNCRPITTTFALNSQRWRYPDVWSLYDIMKSDVQASVNTCLCHTGFILGNIKLHLLTAQVVNSHKYETSIILSYIVAIVVDVLGTQEAWTSAAMLIT